MYLTFPLNLKLRQKFTSLDWEVWQNPAHIWTDITFSIHFHLQHGGGGGGGGSQPSVTVNGGGGGGGGGPISKMLIPDARVLPPVLYIQAGQGGAGGLGGSAGSTGTRSYISIKPTGTTISDVILVSQRIGSALTNRGNSGTGTGGSGGNNLNGDGPTDNTFLGSALGFYYYSPGATGGTGGSANIGSSVIMGASGVPLTGGAGGGGCNSTTHTSFNGGNITGAIGLETILGGTAPGGNGNSGIDLGWIRTGGSGGAGNGIASSIGGNGGNGAPGCGGGGGGAGTATGGGGAGGNGGNGFVIITVFPHY